MIDSAATPVTAPPRMVICTGEPAGIGPDITLQALQQIDTDNLLVVADAQLLQQRAEALGVNLPIVPCDLPARRAPGQTALPAGQINLLPQPVCAPVQPGRLNPDNSAYVLACIDRCVDLCRRHQVAAMITAPVHKGVINDAGTRFSGHTEWITARCRAATSVMLLVSGELRVCLATTHLPLSQVAGAITVDGLQQIIRVIDRELKCRFGIAQPRIGVCGLNPHAGEGGYLGTEEIEIIQPALESLRQQGYRLIGPLPADTAFTPRQLEALDVVLAMYHDQGLPVIKHGRFGQTVNVTLGLPIIRTSVDHGTALSLAGSGQASADSMVAAIDMARQMACTRPG